MKRSLKLSSKKKSLKLSSKKEKLEAQQQKEELDAQQQKEELEAQRYEKELELKHEREMRTLELNACRIATKFDFGKNVRLVPPFTESEVDKYFQHFESVAQNLKWPTDQWPLL